MHTPADKTPPPLSEATTNAGCTCKCTDAITKDLPSPADSGYSIDMIRDHFDPGGGSE